METIVAAVFEEPKIAMRALDDLGPNEPGTDVVSVQVIESHEDPQAILPAPLRGRGGGLLGMALGAVGGVFLAAIMLSLLRFAGQGPNTLLTAGVFAGAFYGGLAGLLATKPRPRLALRRLGRKLKTGRVMVSVGVNNVLAARRVRESLTGHGALATAMS